MHCFAATQIHTMHYVYCCRQLWLLTSLWVLLDLLQQKLITRYVAVREVKFDLER